MKFLIATTNPAKVKEFAEMLGSDQMKWVGLTDIAKLPEVKETGHTFRANAVLKASGYAKATGLWAMADDSGLEVEALNNSPGIYSARWAKMHDAGEGDDANNRLLLEQLKEIGEVSHHADKSSPSRAPSRTARFVCVLAISDPQGRLVLTTRATMEGRIGFAPVGNHGFGYDPLFKVDGMDCTSAELLPAEKHRISHRGRALERMKPLLHLLNL